MLTDEITENECALTEIVLFKSLINEFFLNEILLSMKDA